jgi:hypothetical protein
MNEQMTSNSMRPMMTLSFQDVHNKWSLVFEGRWRNPTRRALYAVSRIELRIAILINNRSLWNSNFYVTVWFRSWIKSCPSNEHHISLPMCSSESHALAALSDDMQIQQSKTAPENSDHRSRGEPFTAPKSSSNGNKNYFSPALTGW